MMEDNDMIKKENSNPDMVKTIGGITFVVRAHFREDNGETMQEKIERMLRNEVENAAPDNDFKKTY